jgi:hypothetical protein
MAKYKEGDCIISGPYLIKSDGKAATPEERDRNVKLAKISQQRGAHMILGLVQDVGPGGIRVEARYLVWDEQVESVDGYNLTGTTFLPVGEEDYALTELFDRERDNVERMIAFLQFAGQERWCAEHEPEEV